jgi:hypothetical protein
MTIFAFAGPSLPAAERGDFPSVTFLPPCEAGDLLRLEAVEGDTICVIDGWFDHRPSLRHKELLLTLSRGVRLFGASSIGALRAAEMAPFGMIGIGAIYRAYADGRLTGDDEVALVHGPAEWDWRPLSVPLVDVRATLCRALRTRVFTPAAVREILRAARALHYVDRTWTEIAAGAALDDAESARLIDWAGRHAVAQKKEDGRACVEAALGPFSARPGRPEAVRTLFLAELERQCAAPDLPAAPAPDR